MLPRCAKSPAWEQLKARRRARGRAADRPREILTIDAVRGGRPLSRRRSVGGLARAWPALVCWLRCSLQCKRRNALRRSAIYFRVLLAKSSRRSAEYWLDNAITFRIPIFQISSVFFQCHNILSVETTEYSALSVYIRLSINIRLGHMPRQGPAIQTRRRRVSAPRFLKSSSRRRGGHGGRGRAADSAAAHWSAGVT